MAQDLLLISRRFQPDQVYLPRLAQFRGEFHSQRKLDNDSMQTNLPEIKSSDLKAALDFLTGDRTDSASPNRPRRSNTSVRPVVAVHNGISRARTRTVKTND
jgi:hypothetical protein